MRNTTTNLRYRLNDERKMARKDVHEAVKVFKNLGFECTDRRGLAPSFFFFFFLCLKKCLKCMKFSNDWEVIAATQQYFSDQISDCYLLFWKG